MDRLPGYVSAEELSKQLGISVCELVGLVRAGRFPPPDMLIGGSFWREEEIKEVLCSGTVQQSPEEVKSRVQFTVAGQNIVVRTDKPEAVKQAVRKLETDLQQLQSEYPGETLMRLLILYVLRLLMEEDGK